MTLLQKLLSLLAGLIISLNGFAQLELDTEPLQLRELSTSETTYLASIDHGQDSNTLTLDFAENRIWILQIRTIDNRTVFFERVYSNGGIYTIDASDLPPDIYLLEVRDHSGRHQFFEIVKLSDAASAVTQR